MSLLIQTSGAVTQAASAGPDTFTMPRAFTKGNSGVCHIAHYQSVNIQVSGVTIGGTPAVLEIRYANGSNQSIEVWRADNIAAPPGFENKVTVAYASDTGHISTFVCDEWPPLGDMDASVTAVNSGTSTSPSVTMAAATKERIEAAYAVFTFSTAVTPTVTPPGTPWLQIAENENGTTQTPISVMHVRTIDKGTLGATWTVSQSVTWWGFIIAFTIKPPVDKSKIEPITLAQWSDLDGGTSTLSPVFRTYAGQVSLLVVDSHPVGGFVTPTITDSNRTWSQLEHVNYDAGTGNHLTVWSTTDGAEGDLTVNFNSEAQVEIQAAVLAVPWATSVVQSDPGNGTGLTASATLTNAVGNLHNGIVVVTGISDAVRTLAPATAGYNELIEQRTPTSLLSGIHVQYRKNVTVNTGSTTISGAGTPSWGCVIIELAGMAIVEHNRPGVIAITGGKASNGASFLDVTIPGVNPGSALVAIGWFQNNAGTPSFSGAGGSWSQVVLGASDTLAAWINYTPTPRSTTVRQDNGGVNTFFTCQIFEVRGLVPNGASAVNAVGADAFLNRAQLQQVLLALNKPMVAFAGHFQATAGSGEFCTTQAAGMWQRLNGTNAPNAFTYNDLEGDTITTMVAVAGPTTLGPWKYNYVNNISGYNYAFAFEAYPTGNHPTGQP